MLAKRLGTGCALLLALTLTGCGGLSLPTPSAPEPSSSYPTIPLDDASSAECGQVASQLNDLSRTLAQAGEALDSGDLLVGMSVLNSLQEQLGDFGSGIEADAELQQHINTVRAAAERIGGGLSEATEDPMAAVQGLQGEFTALQDAVAGAAAYCGFGG